MIIPGNVCHFKLVLILVIVTDVECADIHITVQ